MLCLPLQVEAQSLELKARLADGKSLVHGIANGGINASHLEEAVSTTLHYTVQQHMSILYTSSIVYYEVHLMHALWTTYRCTTSNHTAVQAIVCTHAREHVPTSTLNVLQQCV
jgi:hypothetical protein